MRSRTLWRSNATIAEVDRQHRQDQRERRSPVRQRRRRCPADSVRDITSCGCRVPYDLPDFGDPAVIREKEDIDERQHSNSDRGGHRHRCFGDRRARNGDLRHRRLQRSTRRRCARRLDRLRLQPAVHGLPDRSHLGLPHQPGGHHRHDHGQEARCREVGAVLHRAVRRRHRRRRHHRPHVERYRRLPVACAGCRVRIERLWQQLAGRLRPAVGGDLRDRRHRDLRADRARHHDHQGCADRLRSDRCRARSHPRSPHLDPGVEHVRQPGPFARDGGVPGRLGARSGLGIHRVPRVGAVVAGALWMVIGEPEAVEGESL